MKSSFELVCILRRVGNVEDVPNVNMDFNSGICLSGENRAKGWLISRIKLDFHCRFIRLVLELNCLFKFTASKYN